MFFILSKILAVFLRPMVWIAISLLLALFAKGQRWRRRSLITAVGLFFFFTNPFLLNQVMRWWEPETLTADQIVEPYDIGILLGGYSNSQIVPNHDRHNFSNRANRFINAFELYQSGKIKKILLSGGSGHLTEDRPLEAKEMQLFLLRLGIPDSSIIIESESRNTHENARYTAQIIQDSFPGTSCLLLTSAWHMPRAAACFEKAGLEVTPFAVDYFSETIRFSPDALFFPYRHSFARWEYLIKEWVGLMMYRLKGYI